MAIKSEFPCRERYNSEIMSNLIKQIALPLVIILGALIAGFSLQQMQQGDTDIHVIWQSKDIPACQPEKTRCIQTTPFGNVSFQIAADPVPLMEATRASVATSGMDSLSASIMITGVNMNMGQTRFTLHTAGKTVFEGQIILPVCSQQQMHWQAEVQINTPDGQIRVPFSFSTRNTN